MRNTYRARLLSFLCLVLLLAGVAGGCGSAPPAPEQPFFVPDQVIVIGPLEMVTKTLSGLRADLEDAGLTIDPGLARPLERRELGYVDAVLGSCEDLPQYRKTELGQFVVDVYQLPLENAGDIIPALRRIDRRIPPETPLAAAFAAAINARGNADQVYADLVYRTGRKPLVGSPYEPAASPYEPAASPDGIPGTGVDAVEAFWEQWAFHGEHGIDLIADSVTMEHDRTVGYTGRGVRIGIFDTSPYTTAGMTTIGWLTPTLAPQGQGAMRLEIISPHFYYTWPAPRLGPPASGGEPVLAPGVDDHGLFVAGLLYAVAPRSEIQLYRVLDKYRQGDLATLVVALDSFIKDTLAKKETLTGAVINLSLGLRFVPDMLDNGQLTEGLLRGYGMTRDLLAPTSISLRTVLAAARCHGIVVVAAAGNGSDSAVVRPAEMPASYTDVLGVDGSNFAGTRSCFSNRGKVTAPAGDGDTQCNPALASCKVDCNTYGLIGPVRPLGEFRYGLAYWAGTSFATPLVSGLAALVIEKRGSWPDAKGVSNVISATQGVVNVPQTVVTAPTP